MLITRGKILHVYTTEKLRVFDSSNSNYIKVDGTDSAQYKITGNKKAAGTVNSVSCVCDVQIPLFANTTLVDKLPESYDSVAGMSEKDKNIYAQQAIFKNVPMVTSPGVDSGYTVGSTVLVAFENNLLNNPIIIGQLYIPTVKTKAENLDCVNLTAQNINTEDLKATKTIKTKNAEITGKLTFDKNASLIKMPEIPKKTTHALNKTVKFTDYHLIAPLTEKLPTIAYVDADGSVRPKWNWSAQTEQFASEDKCKAAANKLWPNLFDAAGNITDGSIDKTYLDPVTIDDVFNLLQNLNLRLSTLEREIYGKVTPTIIEVPVGQDSKKYYCRLDLTGVVPHSN